MFILTKEETANLRSQVGAGLVRFYEKDLQAGKIIETIEKIRTAIRNRHGLDTEGGLFPDAVKDLSSAPQLSLFSDAHLDFLSLQRLVKERFEKG